MAIAFVASQGASFAAAVCRHESAHAHAIALHSHDKRVAAQALTEEEAGSIASKKGSPSDGGSPSAASDMLAAATLIVPFRVADAIHRRLTDAPDLAGASIRPLLPPPLD
jgi:hypothetical protein